MTEAAAPGEVLAGDHRRRPRRRGAVLTEAIFAATLLEIEAQGYRGLTVDGVAARAGVSKATLYRRWPNLTQLVLAAVRSRLPDETTLPDSGNLRDDCLTLLRMVAAQLEGPSGTVARGLLGDALRDDTIAAEIRQVSSGHAVRMVLHLLHRAVERGEVDPESVTGPRAEVGPALLRQRFLYYGRELTDDYLVEVVDDVLLPLFRFGRRRP